MKKKVLKGWAVTTEGGKVNSLEGWGFILFGRKKDAENFGYKDAKVVKAVVIIEPAQMQGRKEIKDSP